MTGYGTVDEIQERTGNTLFEQSLSGSRLETWVDRLEVDAEYARLKRA
ncbi:hypothetical protein SY89_00115 [Halolamina pelagica]|uniref:Uncharacterized protein n=1 Tax=Halolamina pelagica TaxID=699431 RepID=A0A0P7HYK3_9EURY|nr:hypothetical protein SY89_00115 [Halolamina pelagica]